MLLQSIPNLLEFFYIAGKRMGVSKM